MNQISRPTAVALLSGGMDSATALAIALDAGFDCYALSVDYGQRSKIELESAALCARLLGASEHRIAVMDMSFVGGSALTDFNIPVPEERSAGIPISYVPARNTIMLSMALAWAEALCATDIYIGVSVVDYSGYPDCRPEYIAAYQAMARLATRATVEGNSITINTPLMDLSKTEIIKRGLELGVDYGKTISCYQARSDCLACGLCDSCVLRVQAFESLGIDDPLLLPPSDK
jgi:7-cyano-7-deazaguanine synthase